MIVKTLIVILWGESIGAGNEFAGRQVNVKKYWMKEQLDEEILDLIFKKRKQEPTHARYLESVDPIQLLDPIHIAVFSLP